MTLCQLGSDELSSSQTVSQQVAACLSKSSCALATFTHITASDFPLDAFDILIEFAQHPESPEYRAAAAVLRRCTCSRHVILEVAAHAKNVSHSAHDPLARVNGSELVQDEADHEDDHDNDSSISEHCHLQNNSADAQHHAADQLLPHESQSGMHPCSDAYILSVVKLYCWQCAQL